MATIQKRGNSYRIRVSVGYDINGKQIMQSKTWRPLPHMSDAQIKRELQKQSVLFEQECLKGHITTAYKFEEFSRKWFKEYAEIALKERTLANYHNLEKRIYKSVGHLRLDKITPRHIQKFILDMNGGERHDKYKKGKLSAKTIRNHVAFISGIFEYAIKMQVVSVNPCRMVTLPRYNPKEKDIYTIEEAQRLLDLLAVEDEKNLHFTLFFTLAMFTGFRRGELLGLEKSDFDYENHVVTVNRTSNWTNEKGIFTDSPKTSSGYRSLKLPPEVFALLERFIQQQNRQKSALGDKWVETGRLFTRWNGEPMFPNTPSLFFGRFCKRTGVRYVNLHNFRHFHASALIYSGVDLKTIQSCMGHSSPSTTINLYCHTFKTAQARAMEAISGMLSFKGNNDQTTSTAENCV